MPQLLIVAHQPSPNTKALTERIRNGARANEEDDQLTTKCLTPFDTNAEDVLCCDGILLFTTENFGYMSGALKDFFDRTYYDLNDEKRGLPYGLIIRAGKDGTGTKRASEGIIQGLGWKKVAEPLILQGAFQSSFLDQAQEYAETFAAGLTCGIF